MNRMSRIKTLLSLILLVIAFNPTKTISGEQSIFTGDISGRWVDDRDQIDIEQQGNVVTGEIGVDGSTFTGTRNGDVITIKLNYILSSGRVSKDHGLIDSGRMGRKSIGELKINSDGTRLVGTRSGGAFPQDSEWVLIREVKK